MKPSFARPGLLALLLYCALAPAQALKDPTRPPPGIAAAAPVAGNGSGSGPQLQSVMLSPSRRSAIISGQLVHRGESYGDAVLAEVAEDHVVLRRGDSAQILRLYAPGVKRQAARAAPK
jgi:MSHA biogenesis protein MshK